MLRAGTIDQAMHDAAKDFLAALLIGCHAALLEDQIEDRLSGRAPACLP